MVGRIWRQTADKNFLGKLEQRQMVTIESTLLVTGGRVKTRTVLLPGPAVSPLIEERNGPEQGAAIVVALRQAAAPQLKASEIRALSLFLELFFAGGRQAVARTTLTRHYPGCGPPLKRLMERNILASAMARVHRNPFG